MQLQPTTSSDPVLFRQLPVIQKIIRDETWLEGERRGAPVRPDDHVVRERVCEVILRVGHQIRESLSVAVRPDAVNCDAARSDCGAAPLGDAQQAR